MTFSRYAIYFVPPAASDWGRFATAWLGWDVVDGAPVAHPQAAGLDVAAITEVPRKYGLHATVKPPFRLAAGRDAADLHAACTTLAATSAPVQLDGLQIARLGRFLALRPRGDETALNALAAEWVQALDTFRAAPDAQELAKRRAAGLTPAQDENLSRWGYPYVMDQFRFHITLTGKLDRDTGARAQAHLEKTLVPLLPTPFGIDALALVGEAGDGRFHLLHRYALSG
ncbi:DUF1045 domain-containing protein [Lutimaribacter marinistellae]|uniref:DUF1045 domain-containing protein n=1 Tax=Lutimaribacter marinistellae TaxID=1820329 RepID=A0ABV7TFR7_9RHOB